VSRSSRKCTAVASVQNSQCFPTGCCEPVVQSYLPRRESYTLDRQTVRATRGLQQNADARTHRGYIQRGGLAFARGFRKEKLPARCPKSGFADNQDTEFPLLQLLSFCCSSADNNHTGYYGNARPKIRNPVRTCFSGGGTWSAHSPSFFAQVMQGCMHHGSYPTPRENATSRTFMWLVVVHTNPEKPQRLRSTLRFIPAVFGWVFATSGSFSRSTCPRIE